jgi:hypothetical protein
LPTLPPLGGFLTCKKQVLLPKQTELQQRPFVIVEPTKDGFQVKNIGNNTALNVRVGEVQVPGVGNVNIVFSFPEPVPTLLKGGCAPLRRDTQIMGEQVKDLFDASLAPAHTDYPSEITVEFENVEMRSYFVKERVAPGRLEVLDSGRL